MNRNRELLLRSLDGELSPAESEMLEASLSGSVELRAEQQRLMQLRKALGESGARSFSDGFSNRVMQRVWEAREASRGVTEALPDGMYESIRWLFVRLAPACLIVAVGLGLYSSVIVEESLSSSIVEAVLGLPAETLDTALFLESM